MQYYFPGPWSPSSISSWEEQLLSSELAHLTASADPSAEMQKSKRKRARRKACRNATAIQALVEDDERTTLVVKNLPASCLRSGFIACLERAGLAGTYDFIHVPTNLRTGESYRYGFVNFVSHAEAESAMERLAGLDCGGLLPAEANWCDTMQGLAAHIERYRNSPLMHADVPEGTGRCSSATASRLRSRHPAAA